VLLDGVRQPVDADAGNRDAAAHDDDAQLGGGPRRGCSSCGADPLDRPLLSPTTASNAP
jgi:hypothetical protein